MILEKDPIRAREAIEDLKQHEASGVVTSSDSIRDFLYENPDIELEIVLLRQTYPKSFYTLHQVKAKFFIIGHIPRPEGIVQIPFWDTKRKVEDIANDEEDLVPT